MATKGILTQLRALMLIHANDKVLRADAEKEKTILTLPRETNKAGVLHRCEPVHVSGSYYTSLTKGTILCWRTR